MHNNYIEDIECLQDGSQTLLEMFISTCKKYPKNNCFGTISNNKLVWEPYEAILHKVERLSSFFNTKTKENSIVGIFSVNRYEWLVSEYASYMSNCINCPLYSTFGPEAVKLIMSETEMTICCCSSDKATSLCEILKGADRVYLKDIVIFEDECNLENDFADLGISVHFYSKIINLNSINLRQTKIKLDDLATICYTSGTSGISKGVLISHKNFIANISAFFRGQTKNEMYPVTKGEVYLSYLPLAHIMERIVVSVILSVGGAIGFYRGNPKEIKKDYMIIRPTFIIAVPRVLNLFKQKIEEGIAARGFIPSLIFRAALKLKKWLQKSGILRWWLLDVLIFNKIANEFGGRIRACLCGSAALNSDVLYFLQASMSMRIFQGYGQTETAGATTLCPMDLNRFDNVGIPYPSCKVKLSPIYGYDKYTGELLVKGGNVTTGYYKRPELNSELFTEDNWLKTGDIARFYNGAFYITGRTKDRFKTGHGEYIEPEKIETMYIGDIINDIIITTISGHDKLVAIVVSAKDDITENDLYNLIIEKGNKFVKEKRMNRYEIPSAIIHLKTGFDTFDNGNLVSPTGKKIRVKIENYFHQEIKKCLTMKT